MQTDAEILTAKPHTCPIDELYLITPEYLTPYLSYIKENRRLSDPHCPLPRKKTARGGLFIIYPRCGCGIRAAYSRERRGTCGK